MTIMWPHKFVDDPNGYTPLECFVHFDTHGEELPCIDTRKYSLIRHGKEMSKLNIQLWCDGVMDVATFCYLDSIEELKKHCEDSKYPEWYFRDFIGQLKKRFVNDPKFGFVPTFLKNMVK